MSIINKIANICSKLGENNKATYAVVTIAAVKGICRPTFTMLDKTEKPETKKYTALREGLTEIIAIPTYLACGAIAAKLGEKSIPKDLTKISNDYLKNLPREKVIKKAANNFRFIGVCIAAVFVIPALCSVAIKPFTDAIMGKPKTHSPKTIQPAVESVKPVEVEKKQSSVQYAFNTPYSFNKFRAGMKVGGV